MTPAAPIRTAERGFTLIELMVVIVIIGLLSAAVVINMGDPAGRVTGEADKFSGRVRAARDSAIVSGRPIAVWVSPTGYGFQRRVAGQWQAFDEGPLVSSSWTTGTVAGFGGVGQLRAVFDTVGRADQPIAFTLQRRDLVVKVRMDLNGAVKTGG